jgi:hypothetical protein
MAAGRHPRDGRATYEIRPILEALVDAGSFFEIGRHWGCAIVTGLARLDGWPVAVVASDPRVQGGSWDSDTAEKFTRLVDLAQAFHLPVVNLVDTPGFQSGLDAERAGTTARCTRTGRGLSGHRAVVLDHPAPRLWRGGRAHQHMGRFNFRYAWPSANWGEVPIEGGLEVAYKSEIEGRTTRCRNAPRSCCACAA